MDGKVITRIHSCFFFIFFCRVLVFSPNSIRKSDDRAHVKSIIQYTNYCIIPRHTHIVTVSQVTTETCPKNQKHESLYLSLSLGQPCGWYVCGSRVLWRGGVNTMQEGTNNDDLIIPSLLLLNSQNRSYIFWFFHLLIKNIIYFPTLTLLHGCMQQHNQEKWNEHTTLIQTQMMTLIMTMMMRSRTRVKPLPLLTNFPMKFYFIFFPFSIYQPSKLHASPLQDLKSCHVLMRPLRTLPTIWRRR
mmetsp:Transcript_6862/g.12921  ORF Transcript_6862/g.12921 Transcript_6862/m.12921 type:complete len:244 (+) Transcript_6862:2069-2800(+)